MKLGLVGYGRWAQNIVKSLPEDVNICAVATGRTDVPPPPGAQRVRYVEDLPFENLDGVIIASKTSEHLADVDFVREFEPLLPIFVEKPLGMDLIDVEDAASRWNSLDPGTPEGRTVFLVDHTQLFNASLVALRALGTPEVINAEDRGTGPFREDCNPLWDYGPHAVALALFLARTHEVHVRDATLLPGPQGCSIGLELRLGANTTAMLLVGNDAPKARHCSTNLGTWEGLAPCATPPLTAALAAFCDAVRAGHAPEGDVRFGWQLPLAVTRVLSDAEEVLRKRCTPL